MKKLLLTLTTLTIMGLSNLVNAQWVQQSSGVTDNLNDVFFLNSQVGYVATSAIGAYYILKTTNGGTNWNQISVTSGVANTIFFTSVDTGYKSYGGSIFKTTNGGLNWTGSAATGSNNLMDIFFTSPSVGYAVGSDNFLSGKMYKTINAGATWNPLSPINTTLYGVNFSSNDTGYVVGYPGSIQRTTDAGATWTVQNSGSTTAYLESVYFIPHTKIGFVAGFDGINGILLATTNGVTWANITPPSCLQLFSVHFIDINNGWVVGYGGAIYYTNDGGLSWTLQSTGTTQLLTSVFFTNTGDGWAVGGGGKILSFHSSAGIAEAQSDNTFSVYPNPALNQLTISNTQLANGKPVTISIMDVTGKLVYTTTTDMQKITVNTTNFATGVYAVQIQTPDFIKTRKVIVAR